MVGANFGDVVIVFVAPPSTEEIVAGLDVFMVIEAAAGALTVSDDRSASLFKPIVANHDEVFATFLDSVADGISGKKLGRSDEG